MTDLADLEKRLHALIMEELLAGRGVELERITPLFAKDFLDSLDMVKLIPLLEETFAMRIDTLEIDPRNFNDIASLAKFVQGKL